MHSVGSISSASSAAGYYASDNYMSEAGEAANENGSTSPAADYFMPSGSKDASVDTHKGEWTGKGAEVLGLSGAIDKQSLTAILSGKLPDGTQVGNPDTRRAGDEHIFSLPKGASIVALVGGDKRILEAHVGAVKEAVAYLEKFAEARDYSRNHKSGEPVRTNNVVAALFHHDTSRSLDPQVHMHALVANLTQTKDGHWRAVWNGEIRQHNTHISAVYHAAMRNAVEKLGYKTEIVGKHGSWDIAGIPKEVKGEFSTRRNEIVEKSGTLGITSPQGQDKVALNTRDKKVEVEDRASLYQSWLDRSLAKSFDPRAFVEQAKENTRQESAITNLKQNVAELAERIASALSQKPDQLLDDKLTRLLKSPEDRKAEFAVRSAVNMLSEREAAFSKADIERSALNFAVGGLNIDAISKRIGQLEQRGALIPEKTERIDGHTSLVTTPPLLATEQKIVAQIALGKGAGQSILDPEVAVARLQEHTKDRPLNQGQLGAATSILSSADRITAVQGDAGTGKSTMISAVNAVAEHEGKTLIGLAFQNKMVADLREGAGVEAHTIASFLGQHFRTAVHGQGPAFEQLRNSMKNTIIAVDESSMVSNKDMQKLTEFANVMQVARLVLIGDRQQLSSIEAGKSFAVSQAAGISTERMSENLRQKTDQLKAVAALATNREIGAAFAVLNDKIINDKDNIERAANEWLALSPQDRAETAIFTSGRSARADINTLIQDGLKNEGTIGGQSLNINILQSTNHTREEMRFASTYQRGQILEAKTHIAELKLSKGEYRVERIDHQGRVFVRDAAGKLQSIDPQKFDAANQNARLGLYTEKNIDLHTGDKIRFTANDPDRKEQGVVNSTIARILSVDDKGVMVETHNKNVVALTANDPMLARLDLAYSLNMHMAQGITSRNAIVVMSADDKHLSNARLFTVAVTRVENDIKLVTDDKDRLAAQIDRNSGDKHSSLETVGALTVDDKPKVNFEKFEIPSGAPDAIIKDVLEQHKNRSPEDKGAAPPEQSNNKETVRENQPEKKIDIGLA